MPGGFDSEAQRRLLWATKPSVAQQIYDDASPKERHKRLPYHVSKRKGKRSSSRR